MITREKKKEILCLVEEMLTAQNDMNAELVCGHDWERYAEEFHKTKEALEQYLETITA